MKKSIRFGSSKGISTVVGTIFLVITVFVIATNIFLWTMMENTRYNQAVKESRQMDEDRSSERIVASHASYTALPPDTVVVDVTLSNEGPVAAQIITMWVVWTYKDLKSYGFENTLDIGLNPGDKVSPTIPVSMPGVQPNGTFSGWLVTARGNRVSLEKEEENVVVVAQVAKGIGSIHMDLDNFKYYYWNSKTEELYPPNGIISTNIVITGDSIVFGVLLSNYDEYNRTIALDSRSLLWLYSPASGSRAAAEIVTVVDGKAKQDYYDPESGRLAHRETKCIYFGPVSKGFLEGLKACAVNLILLGEIGSDEDGWTDYGQNIPFVSIYVTS